MPFGAFYLGLGTISSPACRSCIVSRGMGVTISSVSID